METFVRTTLYLHIAAGFMALITGAWALAVAKGDRTHRKTGTVFFWSMVTVTLTATVVCFARHNVFLLMIAVFSGYLAFTGYRALAFRRSAEPRANALDWAVLGVAALFVAWMAFEAGRLSIGKDGAFRFNSFALVLLVFGASLANLVRRDIRTFRNPRAPSRLDWLRTHIERMGGAYIAAVTAFLVVNVQTEPAFIPWLLPGLLGGFGIRYFVRKYVGEKPRVRVAR